MANIKRVQEAARSLEEFGKLLCPEIGFSFKQFRFHTYTLEKNLADALRYRDRLVPCWDICVITGDCRYKGRSAAEVVSQAIAGGAMIIQLREKELTTRRLVETGRHIREITRKAGALFLIDGHVDVALAVGADGVHLGQDEMQIKDVRMLLGDRKIIGASAGSVEEACLAEQEGADFIEIGPVFPTGDAQAPQGLQLIRNIKKAVRIPCLAVGGINHDNISGVIRAGADGAAISTAVVSADDIQAAAAGLKRVVLNTKEQLKIC